MQPTAYVLNPFGGFQIDFLNRYINDYMKYKIGLSYKMIDLPIKTESLAR